jgi:hypothetical protein
MGSLQIGRTKKMKDEDNERVMRELVDLLKREFFEYGITPPTRTTPGQVYWQYDTLAGTILRPWIKVDGAWR